MPEEEVGSAYATIGIKIDEAGLNAAQSKLSSSVNGLEGKFKSGFASGLQSSLSGMTASMGPLGGAIDGVAGSLGLAGMAAGAGVLALGALGAASVSTAANWESLMASVSKTTGVEGSGLDQLSNDLQQIRMETGATAEEIANVAITAGSVGIPTAELSEFTQVALQLGSAFSMSSEAAVSGIAAIGNVTKPAEMAWSEFGTKAGSTVNDLADAYRTSEEQILTGMKHLGATMGLLKPPADTLPAWMALVTTVQSLGLEGDSAGEAIQDAMMYAVKDAKGAISGLLGMSGEELQLNLRSNAPEVMQQAAEAIASLPLEEQGEALAQFGSTGSKAIALLMGDLDPASGKFEKLGDAIDTANKGWEEGASLASAYGKSQETFNASIDRLYASLDVAGQKLGTVFLPLLADGIDLLTSGVQAAIGFGSAVSELFSSDLGGIFGTNKEDMYQDIVDKKRAAEAGKEIGDEVGKGVAESDDLKAAPGEALGSDETLSNVAKSAEDLAKRVSEEMVAGIQSGMSDLDILAMINSQSSPNKEKTIREFEYLGQQIRMAITRGSGQGSYSIYSDDTLMGSGIWDAKHFDQLDPLEAFELATGMPAPEEGTAAYYRLLGDAVAAERAEMQDTISDLYLDVAANTKNEVETAGKQIADAFAAGMVPDSAQISASLDSLRHLQLYDPEEAKSQGAENAIYYLDALKDSIEAYDAAKAKYLVEPDNKQALEDLERTRSNLQQKLAQNPLTVKVKAEWGQFDTKSLSELIYDPAALAAAAKNPELFFTGTIVPGIRSGMEAARDAIATGQITEEDVYDAFIKPLESVTEFLPYWLDNMNKMFKLGWIDADEYLRSLEGFLGNADKASTGLQNTAQAAKTASVGYNQLQKAVEDCEACLMSDFGAWQEAQDNLFNPSYIGQGGQAYLDWKNSVVSSVSAASAAVQAAGGVALGAGAQPQSVTAKLNLDTSAATSAMSAFEATAKTDIKKPLTIDSSGTAAAIAAVDDTAKKSVSKPLTIDTSQAMGAIASINAAASAPVYKTVYVTEVNTGGSGGSGAGAGAGGGFGYSLPPIFMARGGYVSRPTLAVVGEAGPEYVIPAENMANGLSRMGGGEVNITINSPIYGGDGQDVEALLAQRNKELVAEITAQISEARRGL